VLEQHFWNSPSVLTYEQVPYLKMAVFWVVAASTSETSVNFYQTTWHNNPEGSHLHTRHHENLKSHRVPYFIGKQD
jgi:hypothetical protein